MFSAGNVVRQITYNGDGEMLYVKTDSDPNTGITDVTDSNGMVTGYDTRDLELVTDQVEEHVSAPMELNSTHMNIDDLHDEINKYFVSLIERAKAHGYDGSLQLKINAYATSGSTSTDIDYIACCGYEEDVKSGNLTFSVDTAVRRHLENKEMQVPAIPHYK